MTLCDPDDMSPTREIASPDLPVSVPALRIFYAYLSSSCNLSCRHCWIVPRFTAGRPDPGDFMDPDLLYAAVHEGKPLGLQSVKLTGGEPLLHPRFIEIVDLLSAEGLSLNVETNATLLTAETARYLKDKTRVVFVSISLDGADADTHDDFRGVPGAYEATLRGLGYLVAAGYGNVQLIMSVHKGNYDQIEAVVRLAAERGAASVKLNPVTRTGRGTGMHERDETLDFDGHRELADYIYRDLRPRAPVAVILNVPPALTPLPELRRTRGLCGDCNVSHVMGILSTNDYALCGIGQTCPELIYGRLGRDRLRDIWLTHPVILNLRQTLEDIDSFPGICGRCIHAGACLTGCVANNYTESGQLIAPNWMCAEADRRGLFPAGRAQRLKTV